MRPKISALIITRNEELRLERCLKSLQWVDEIVIVDNFSEDRRIEIAARYGCHIIQNKQISFGGQRNIAIQNANGHWMFHLDADEVVPPELQKEIQSRVLDMDEGCVAYTLVMRIYFLGKHMKHGGWYTDSKKIRLTKKGSGWFKETVHEGFIPNGKVGNLNQEIRSLFHSFGFKLS